MGKRRIRWQQNPPELSSYLSTAAAAELVGVSTRCFYDLVGNSALPCFGVGRKHLFKRDDVLKLRRELYGR